jgi:pimeloyl-ACP methyl ester carboxylesterase
LKKKLVFGFIVIALLPAAAYFLFPEILLDLARNVERRSSDLVKREARVDDHRIVYLEGGKGETILLLHGYGSDKDNWTRFAKYLTSDYHVVIPDLAGFGESSKLSKDNYDIENQVTRIDRFTEVLKLGEFHVVGHSMGGMIAAVYGVKYPQKVLTLALMAPAGLKSPQKSEFAKQLEKGINPYLVGTPDEYEKLISFLFVKPPPIPASVKIALAAQKISQRAFNEKILTDLRKAHLSLEPFLPAIHAPVLIIWGDTDKILDVSCVSILEKKLKNYQTVIMKEMGHVPILERPQETAISYLYFLKNTTYELSHSDSDSLLQKTE